MDDKELQSLLFSAIEHKNASLLEDLLKAENGVKFLDEASAETGNTPLHAAVLASDITCVECLLRHGADPNKFDANRARSPLHLAVELGHTEIVKAFLKAQYVDLELRCDRSLTVWEIAQFCDNQELADLIQDRQEEIEKFKNEFYTNLNRACSNNDIKLLKELVTSYERKIINGLPKGWHAHRDKKQYASDILRDLINWSSSSYNDVTLLFKSASKGHTETCKLLIELGADAKCNENTNYSPLYVAAYGGYVSTVKLLLERFPALIKEATIEKWTVLHACCLQGHSETAKLILNYPYPAHLKQQYVTSSQYEYEFAFNLNAQDAAGQTAIYLAVSANNESLLDTLLGFNIEAKLVGLTDGRPLEGNTASLRHTDEPNRASSAKIVPDQIRPKSNQTSERGNRFYPGNQIDKIMRQLRKLQFSKEVEQETVETESSCPASVGTLDNKYLICPFEMDIYCDYNSKTALHLAIIQQYHNIATTLLVNGSNPNLPILFKDPIKSNSPTGGGADVSLTWLRSSKSTCLKEACRLNDETLCETLVRYGARDTQDNLALQVAAANKNHRLISLFLALKSSADPEYKINRKCNVEFASRYKQSKKLSDTSQLGGPTTTFSSMFPSTPVTIDWQNLKCIYMVDPAWLIDASLAHNKRLRHPTNSLMAITRLDLSSNNLKSVHPVIFRLPSLRELNLSSNRLESLIAPTGGNSRLAQECQVETPTSKLIESHRIAMKRSKSSNLSGVNLESSNLLDLNEPQSAWDLPYIESIDLHDNLLISLPDCLFGLSKLRELDVSSNQLRQLPLVMWSAPSLCELVASGNLLDDLPKVYQSPSTRSSSSGISSPATGALSDVQSENESTSSSFLASNRSFDKALESSLASSLDSELTGCEPDYLKRMRQSNNQWNISDRSLAPSVIPITHLNYWSSRLTMIQTTDLNDQSSAGAGAAANDQNIALCKLTYINLSHNSFIMIPPVLACVATKLTRLNMSYNRIESLGDIGLYPSKLKTLDLSYNQIITWFQLDQSNDTKHCYTENINRSHSVILQRGSNQFYCVHKLHQRLEHLKSLNLSHNLLGDIRVSHRQPMINMGAATQNTRLVGGGTSSVNLAHQANAAARQSAAMQHLLYPNITSLDVSYNHITRVPERLCELKDLSVLNLSGNPAIVALPPELGLATKLWNLGLNGCNLTEPIKSISKSGKTADIIGYLRSILEEAKPYARMKLMLVGLQGIGKTSLLEQMRHEGSAGPRRRAPEHWTKRMGHSTRGNLRNQKGVTLSTVGVDIHDWIFQKRVPRNQQTFGPVSFSTWDFGGQEEFYATHRYFLSKRSMYLVVWRLTDGLEGISSIQQWLVNIQSRAPGSPVIIVGTHEDLVEGGEEGPLVRQLQAELHKRFIDVSDHDKCGLPRIMDSIVVSTKTKLNIRTLCNRIYDVVFSLRCPGSTERLLEQKIPATYLYLEEIISSIAHDRHQKRREPVLTYEEYRLLASEQLKSRYNKVFRDLEPLNSREINYNSELQQATRFLHENGVILHYESTLKDLYFVDPQWLCDILSHVVTVREINPHVKNGLMKIDDLNFLFKSLNVNLSGGIQSYVVNLLNKFEVALTWNSQYLLIPSLLPTSPELLCKQADMQVKLAPRMRGRSVARRATDPSRTGAGLRSSSIEPSKRLQVDRVQTTAANRLLETKRRLKNFYDFEIKPANTITRLVLLRYLPAGFLARLQSSILSDPAFEDACEELQLNLLEKIVMSEEEKQEPELISSLIGAKPGWLCWKKGLSLSLQKESTINTRLDDDDHRDSLASPVLMSIQECSPGSPEFAFAKANFKIKSLQIDCNDKLQQAIATSGEQDQLVLANKLTPSNDHNHWINFDVSQYSNIIILTLPNPSLKVTRKDDHLAVHYHELDHSQLTRLFARAVDYIDDLLEDWYPSLGARFAHTLGGNYLVTRIVPCPECARPWLPATSATSYTDVTNNPHHRARNSRASSAKNAGVKFSINSAAATSEARQGTVSGNTTTDINFYYVEECFLNVYDLPAPLSSGARNSIVGVISQNNSPPARIKVGTRHLQCPAHGSLLVRSLAPDILFDDVHDSLKISNEQIERCKLIGRGAMGFVFKGCLRSAFPLNQLGQANQEVALKLLQPVEPGPEAEQADIAAYQAAKSSWAREPYQSSCKSYCTARHEVNILQALYHPNIVSFIGLCIKPLAIVLELAPLGCLSDVFKNYKRSYARVEPSVAHKCILQVAKALEFLHQNRVIYRDLKADNILVWSFPSPFATQQATAHVELKLADYGISRQANATGIWKGFAGTMSYLAPEILRHNGDEEYTEKVDIFSFGMFMYELLTMRQPYNKQGELAGGGISNVGNVGAGSRPAVAQQDLIYPSHMIDLMCLCWSQEPNDRPTASQIISLASTPEFMQVKDAVLVADYLPTSHVVDHQHANEKISFSCAVQAGISAINLWLDTGGGGSVPRSVAVSTLSIISTSSADDRWIAHETFKFWTTSASDSKQVRPTAMCLVDDKIWLCDSQGTMHIVNASPRGVARETRACSAGSFGGSMSPYKQSTSMYDGGDEDEEEKLDVSSFTLNFNPHSSMARLLQQQQQQQHRELTDKIKSMIYVKWADSVVLLTYTGRLWIFRTDLTRLEPLEDSSIAFNCIALRDEYQTFRDKKRAAAATSTSASFDGLKEATSFQLVCGQTNGISCLSICENEVRRQSILPLAAGGQSSSSSSSPSANIADGDHDSLESITSQNASAIEISHIVTPAAISGQAQTGDDSNLLWTAAGCTVHLWNIKEKHVIRKLDCWKLVPCSESLESINIEQYYEDAKLSNVTSMAHTRDQLFVGTSFGCLIVIEANSLKPITVLRLFESNLIILRPLVRPTRQEEGQSQGAQASDKPASPSVQSPHHLVALGLGYRDLMKRYLSFLGDSPMIEARASQGRQHQETSSRDDKSKKLVAILLDPSVQYNL